METFPRPALRPLMQVTSCLSVTSQDITGERPVPDRIFYVLSRALSQELCEQSIWNSYRILVHMRGCALSNFRPVWNPIWQPGRNLGFSFTCIISRTTEAIHLKFLWDIGTYQMMCAIEFQTSLKFDSAFPRICINVVQKFLNRLLQLFLRYCTRNKTQDCGLVAILDFRPAWNSIAHILWYVPMSYTNFESMAPIFLDNECKRKFKIAAWQPYWISDRPEIQYCTSP